MREPPVVMCAWIISDVVRCIQLFTYCVVDKPSFVRNRVQTFAQVVVETKTKRPLRPFAFLDVVFPLPFHNSTALGTCRAQHLS